VARDGIEPPTPAFSGLDSPRVIAFKTKDQGSLDVPKTVHLLGQERDKNGTRFWPVKTAFPLLPNSATPSARSPAADVDLNGKEDTRRYRATPPIEMRSRPTQATR
jgi:hypothetical protein